MCEPTTVTMTYLAIAAGATQAYSQVQQGKDAMGTARFNARELENQATDIRNKGTEEENIKRRENAEFLSQQRAMLGASGIDIDSGSAGDLQQDTQLLGEVDALRIRRNFQDQADVAERQSVQVLAEGRAQRRAANTKALGTALSTAATVGMINAPVPAGAPVATTGTVSPKWYADMTAAPKFSPWTP